MDANQRSEKITLPVMILNAYNEYISVGYPVDTAIYRIRASKSTFGKMKEYLQKNFSFIPKVELSLEKSEISFGDHIFRLEIDSNLGLGNIVFGPEQIKIKWSGK